jgi:hypothetical protein
MSIIGNWGEVWDSFDRKKKKIIGIEPAAENDAWICLNRLGLRRSRER